MSFGYCRREFPPHEGSEGTVRWGAAGPSSHTSATPVLGIWEKGELWALWESRGGWRTASAPKRVIAHPCPLPALSLPHSRDPQQGVWGHHTQRSGGTWTLGAQQVLRRPSESSGTDVPHPVGDECQWKETHSWHLVNEAALGTGGKAGGIGRVLGRPGTRQSPFAPSLAGYSQSSDVCSEGNEQARHHPSLAACS